jgi:hypothetical protein
MGERQPAHQFDQRPYRSAQIPRKLLQNGLAAIPGFQIVRIDEVEVLVVLAADHGIFAVNLAGEQGHALVRAADPFNGDILKETKSVVSINSDRIATPL